VWLSGTARTRQEADRAVEIARGTDGVVRVKSDIVVRSDK
jgi:osmotically-inducible protein OsmY